MQTIILIFLLIINIFALIIMGIDKWKARHNRYRISEKTLFCTAILGGSLGILIGIYLFRHKTRHLRFTIGIPVILVIQLLCAGYLMMHIRENRLSPSAVVSDELKSIQQLDDDTIKQFATYDNIMHKTAASDDIGPDAVNAIKLFFTNFSYHIHSEKITGDTASVSVEIINIDTCELARDLCLALTQHNLSVTSDNPETLSTDDYYTLLYNTLQSNTYPLTASTAWFHLKRSDNRWMIQSDETLQDQLVSGFISWMNDSFLLTPEDILTIYLDAFSKLNVEEWLQYFSVHDIFATGSSRYANELDRLYVDKIAEYFAFQIDSCKIQGNQASAVITLTSVDMTAVLKAYNEKLLKYASSSESITSDSEGQQDAVAKYLMEALTEASKPADIKITVALSNDGHTWQFDISDELTNAFLGNIQEALKQFNAS